MALSQVFVLAFFPYFAGQPRHCNNMCKRKLHIESLAWIWSVGEPEAKMILLGVLLRARCTTSFCPTTVTTTMYIMDTFVHACHWWSFVAMMMMMMMMMMTMMMAVASHQLSSSGPLGLRMRKHRLHILFRSWKMWQHIQYFWCLEFHVDKSMEHGSIEVVLTAGCQRNHRLGDEAVCGEITWGPTLWKWICPSVMATNLAEASFLFVRQFQTLFEARWNLSTYFLAKQMMKMSKMSHWSKSWTSWGKPSPLIE